MPGNPLKSSATIVMPFLQRFERVTDNARTFLNSELPGRGFQLVLVDDGSCADAERHPFSDPEIAASAAIQCISLEENLGPGQARNVGALAGSGLYLLFWDSDDTLDLKSVPEAIKEMERAEAEIGFFAYRDHNGEIHFPARTSQEKLPSRTIPHLLGRNFLLFANCTITPSVIIRNQGKPVFPAARHMEDQEAWVRLVVGDRCNLLLSPIVLSTTHRDPSAPGGLAGDRAAMLKGHFRLLARIARAHPHVAPVSGIALVMATISFMAKRVRRRFHRIQSG